MKFGATELSKVNGPKTGIPAGTYDLETDFTINLKEHGSEIKYSTAFTEKASLNGTTLTIEEGGIVDLVVTYLPKDATEETSVTFFITGTAPAKA